MDGIKTSVKLQLLNDEDVAESGGSEIVLELGRALYKLHFQLLLLLEAAHKMVSALSTIARMHKVKCSVNQENKNICFIANISLFKLLAG